MKLAKIRDYKANQISFKNVTSQLSAYVSVISIIFINDKITCKRVNGILFF